MGGPRLVQWPRFSDAWAKLFGVQGNTALNVVDDCFITLPAEDELLHLSWLRGWVPFSFVSLQTAVAAQFATITVQAGAGALVVIEGFTLKCAAAANQEVNIGSVTNPVATTPGSFIVGPRDSRVPFTPGGGATVANRAPISVVPSAQGFQYLTAMGQTGLRLISTPPGFPTYVNPIPYVVAAGANLIFEATSVNTDLTVNVWGRYREATQLER